MNTSIKKFKDPSPALSGQNTSTVSGLAPNIPKVDKLSAASAAIQRPPSIPTLPVVPKAPSLPSVGNIPVTPVSIPSSNIPTATVPEIPSIGAASKLKTMATNGLDSVKRGVNRIQNVKLPKPPTASDVNSKFNNLV